MNAPTDKQDGRAPRRFGLREAMIIAVVGVGMTVAIALAELGAL